MAAMFIHTVYFWLVDSAGEDVRGKMLTDIPFLLGQIPTVRHCWVGKPAMTPRDVVDNSYSVGLCVALDDVKGHDEYQAHALHAEFIARYKQYWKKVQVYDFKQ
jgi:hypothetical protein